MGAGESKDSPLLLKRRFTPDERKELRRNVHYNPEEELASGIEHTAQDKVSTPGAVCRSPNADVIVAAAAAAGLPRWRSSTLGRNV